MQTIPFSQARAQLASTLQQVTQSGEPTTISRRGQSAAVVMSIAQYERMSGGAENFSNRLAAWRAVHIGENSVAVDDDPWAQVRDLSPGREFAW
jgi:prevent-host-death family protein